ncbi:MAG: ABC transporter permease [Chitinophagaceae bacterium]|nr:ABC transporter permease [Bacteroidota bacterium]MCC6258971.1 ABC transporter permease [Chitinophagaceae bacterium]MCW5917170.1 ABC transporter permease [Ferruginibacter sp.]
MKYRETLSLSWNNIRSNKLRSAITIVIIALGIFALILIITAITAASNSLTSSFSTLGANAFSIRYKDRNIRFGGPEPSTSKSKKGKRERKSNMGIPITYAEAMEFKQRYTFPNAKVSIGLRGPFSIVANTNSKKTNPDINMFGGDDNYLELNGYNLQAGRNFTQNEVQTGRNVCFLGSGVATRLFGDNPLKAIDAIVSLDHKPYRVIGVLEDKGSSAFFNTSKIVVTPVNTVRRLLSGQNPSYTIAVQVPDLNLMDVATGEAIAEFRPIRKLNVKDENNFFIDKSDSIAESMLTSLGFLQTGTIGIALVTLIGAAIGLMNIMLVAVNERTKEIGLEKALGAKGSDIRRQFLYESILISILGAAVGIISGVLVGNLVALLLKTGFVVPWIWVGGGILVCTLVGLLAGLYPAIKASKLDPIVALRYE